MVSLDPCFAEALGLPPSPSPQDLAERFAQAGGVSPATCPASVAVLCEVAMRTEQFVVQAAGSWVMEGDCPSAVVQRWERRFRLDDEWQAAERDLRSLREPEPSLSDVLFGAVEEVGRLLTVHGCLKDVASRNPVRGGDRFRLTRDAEVYAMYSRYAPSHTVGGPAVLPKGTVIVALDQSEGALGFSAYPEPYDELEDTVVPPEERASPGYAGGYSVSFTVNDIGDPLEVIEPLRPRPAGNRLPRLWRLGGPEWPDD
jgi:hypothetical protein